MYILNKRFNVTNPCHVNLLSFISMDVNDHRPAQNQKSSNHSLLIMSELIKQGQSRLPRFSCKLPSGRVHPIQMLQKVRIKAFTALYQEWI